MRNCLEGSGDGGDKPTGGPGRQRAHPRAKGAPCPHHARSEDGTLALLTARLGHTGSKKMLSAPVNTGQTQQHLLCPQAPAGGTGRQEAGSILALLSPARSPHDIPASCSAGQRRAKAPHSFTPQLGPH